MPTSCIKTKEGTTVFHNDNVICFENLLQGLWFISVNCYFLKNPHWTDNGYYFQTRQLFILFLISFALYLFISRYKFCETWLNAITVFLFEI